jgi:uncharacterized protein (TIGR02453 family)
MATTAVERFVGFPAEALGFLAELKAHNEKAWFEANRGVFEGALVAPGRALVMELGGRLQREVSSTLRVEPKIGGSIMRQHRDTRFSKDKSPYKTYFGLWFWEGEGRSSTRPGFYLGFSGDELTLGAGKHVFEDEQLGQYRAAVVDERSGAELARMVAAVRETGAYEIGGQTYKNVPAQYGREHPRGELLKHTGLHAERREPAGAVLHDAGLVDYVMAHYHRLAPLVTWLGAHV